ncbi:MAG: nuclear transport factor 2 family protein [Spirochaetales bacterium]|nr:nuclear transport factor 2 family protein [Spirochaetales bacterium]
MKNSFRFKFILSLFICFLCFLCFLCFGCQDPPVVVLTDEALIEQVMDKEITAFNQGEMSSFRQIYADDAVLTLTANTADTSDDIISTGNPILNIYEGYHIKHSNIQQTVSLTEMVITGNTATLVKSGTIRATFDASGIETSVEITPDVWELEKRDGTWLITTGWWNMAKWW